MKDLFYMLGIDYIEFDKYGDVKYIHGVTNKKKLKGDEDGYIQLGEEETGRKETKRG